MRGGGACGKAAPPRGSLFLSSIVRALYARSLINDPDLVRREYLSLDRLASRRLDASGWIRGVDELETLLHAVAEVRPRRLLDAGCGDGWAAVLTAVPEVVGVDKSEAAVEAARTRGVDARVADLQDLPFADGEFDIGMCNHVLYHLPNRHRGIAELARVLRPGGRFVGIYNYMDHLREIWDTVGDPWRDQPGWGCEDAQELQSHFSRVECRETEGQVVWLTRGDLQAYLDAYAEMIGELTAPEGAYPFVARRHNCVLVAEKESVRVGP